MRIVIVLEHLSLFVSYKPQAGERKIKASEYDGWITPYSDAILGTVLKKQMNMPFDLLLRR
jgi:hypothetical protein